VSFHTGQGDSSFGLTSAPQFPKNALMVASLSTPKPPLAATMRKAISYPFAAGLTRGDDVVAWMGAITASLFGDLALDCASVSVAGLFDALASNVSGYLKRRGIALVLMPCQGHVTVDLDRMLIALQNIVMNSAEAIKVDAGVITIEGLWRPSEVEIKISDNGRGVSDAGADRLFTPFFTVDRGHVLGLGLTVSKQIIEAHGGTIALHSSGAEGTTLAIMVPTQGRTTGSRCDAV
jgi:signal transduction histidine kinase